jgi:hypothetical protein
MGAMWNRKPRRSATRKSLERVTHNGDDVWPVFIRRPAKAAKVRRRLMHFSHREHPDPQWILLIHMRIVASICQYLGSLE